MYGKSVKHQPQHVGLAHELADEDIGMSLRGGGHWRERRDRLYANPVCSTSVTVVKR